MSDEWTVHGVEFATCNCDWGCPCQFGAPTTHGHCEAIVCGHIEHGQFNDTPLDGLDWALLVSWPGEIADGNGTQQAIISDQADPDQREALRKILHGESTTPGSTHFFVYNSTMTNVLETLYAPIELSIDVDERIADVRIDGLVESTGRPIINRFSGEAVRSRIDLPGGFEYTLAEMGNGNTRVRAGIELDLTNTYGQFNVLHMNQDGVIR
ncbi:MAG TPA: DUF1326 domain-containing protein [Solirubrobacteraceae bacterium]|nr:DUF1326 domain-containing protein [Solirubrobacteraceae bacterium]